MRNFDVFFSLSELKNKQSSIRWCETPIRPRDVIVKLWRSGIMSQQDSDHIFLVFIAIFQSSVQQKYKMAGKVS